MEHKYQSKDVKKQIWTIEFVNKKHMPKETWGTCDRTSKQIKVRYDLCEETVLDTLLHELLHSNNELLFEAEEFVTDLATALAKSLLASGLISVDLNNIKPKRNTRDSR